MAFVEGFLSGALSGLFVKVATAVYGRVGAAEPPSKDPNAYLLGSDLVLTSQQLRTIGELLATPEVASLVQTHAALSLIDTDNDEYEKLREECKSAFDNFFYHSISELVPESGASDVIWNLVLEYIAVVAPRPQDVGRLTLEEQNQLLEADIKQFDSIPAKQYIRIIRDVMSSADEVQHYRTLCADICRGTEIATSQLEVQHTQEHHKYSQDQLYVSRTLAAPSGDEATDINKLLTEPRGGMNLVVLGHPGAGKSTLVTKVIHDLARKPNRDIAPILIKCRDFGVDVPAKLVDHIAGSVSTIVTGDVESTEVQTLLALGRCVLVFDGVDEITDTGQRRQLISAIERLAVTFPLSPIMCTTRKVGYETAKFSPVTFRVAELEEFSPSQVEDYVGKWFALMGKSTVDERAFLHESEEVDDIRRNPLMLSLLCTLYRVRGFIPMNRYDVYKACADLLFYTWDSMRHIPQPVDHKRYGNNLMEELAYLFFNSRTAGSGIQELQLKKLVSRYFRDTAGVEPHEADVRAGQFLDFCANRAWILTSAGLNAKGQRLFSFTHRTFMEFFAAEAIVRRAPDEDTVCNRVIEVFQSNPSSVVPDLIIHAYENKTHQGAAKILRRLVAANQRGRDQPSQIYVPLCLRVLNSAPVSMPLVIEVLTGAFRSYAKPTRGHAVIDKVAFISVLQLYQDPRNICIRLLTGKIEGVEAAEVEVFRRLFLASWSRLWHGAKYRHLEAGWEDCIDGLVQDAVNQNAARTRYLDPPTEAFLVRNRHIPVPTTFAFRNDALVIDCFSAGERGLLVDAIFRDLAGKADATDHEIVDRAADSILDRPPLIDEHVRRYITFTLDLLHTDLIPAVRPRPRPATGTILVALACLYAELSSALFIGLHDNLDELLPDVPIARILRTRLEATNSDDALDERLERAPWLRHATPLKDPHTDPAMSELPRWIADWAANQLSTVRGNANTDQRH